MVDELAAERTEALAWIASILKVEVNDELRRAVMDIAAAYDADQAAHITSFKDARDKLAAMRRTIDRFLEDMGGLFPKKKGGFTIETSDGIRGFGQATQVIGQPPRTLSEAEEWRQLDRQWDLAQSALNEISRTADALRARWKAQPGRGISTVEDYANNPPHWRLADRCFDLWRHYHPDMPTTGRKLIDLCGYVFNFTAADAQKQHLRDVEGHIRELLTEKPA